MTDKSDKSDSPLFFVFRIILFLLVAIFTALLLYNNSCLESRISRLEGILRRAPPHHPQQPLNHNHSSSGVGTELDGSHAIASYQKIWNGTRSDEDPELERRKRNALDEKYRKIRIRMAHGGLTYAQRKMAGLPTRKLRAVHLLLNYPKTSRTVEFKPPLIPWKLSNGTGGTKYFSVSATGQEIRLRSGTYFIYVQVYFTNKAPRSFFELIVGGKTVLKCMQSVDSIDSKEATNKTKTCYAGAVVRVDKGQPISVRNSYNTTVGHEELATYMGFIPL